MEDRNRYHDVVWTPEKIKKFWNLITSDAELGQQYFTKEFGTSIVKLMAKHVPLRGKTLLDYGCGPGHLFEAARVRSAGIEYYGVDFSDRSVAELNERFRDARGFNGATTIGDLRAVELHKKFDIIACCEVIEHLEDGYLEQLLQFFRRHLNADGFVFLTTPNQEVLAANSVYCPDCSAHFHRWQHMRSWNPKSLDAFLKTGGFTQNSFTELNLHPIAEVGAVKTFLTKKLFRRRPSNLIAIARL